MRGKNKGATTSGITLVALVVTIVILLILAGITIIYVMGDNGVFGQASQAKVQTELGKIEEQAGTIYYDKFIENQGTNNKITAQAIVDELERRGNSIETRSAGGSIIGISLEPATVTIDQNKTATVKVKIEKTEYGNLYYAVVDGKYYRMNFKNGQLEIERNATNPEGNKEEPASIEIEPEYDTTLITVDEINQSEKTIAITGNETKYGNTTIKVKYGDETATCQITVIQPLNKDTITSDTTSWEAMNRIAIAIAKDSSVTNATTKATGTTEQGEKYEISVGETYKVKYDGTEVRVRVLGFKHDDLVNTGAYGGNHTKASISFEFYDLMTGDTYKQMNTINDTTGGWGATQMRKDLNGYTTSDDTQSGTIGGLGAKLSNKSYIKQVKKQYIKTYSDASTNQNYTQDYLWLLVASEVVKDGYKTGYYSYAITTEGSQYKYYQGVTQTWKAKSAGRVKYKASGGASSWWIRSPYYGDLSGFCSVNNTGLVDYYYNYASGSDGVAPGFVI